MCEAYAVSLVCSQSAEGAGDQGSEHIRVGVRQKLWGERF